MIIAGIEKFSIAFLSFGGYNDCHTLLDEVHPSRRDLCSRVPKRVYSFTSILPQGRKKENSPLIHRGFWRILWILWIIWWISFPLSCRNLSKSREFKAFPNCQLIFYVNINIHIASLHKMLKTMWILWITYFPNSFSPTFTISPAPIVINKSPGTQFSKINVSISSNEGR